MPALTVVSVLLTDLAATHGRNVAPCTAPGDSAPMPLLSGPPPPPLTFLPKENIGLQGAGVHIGDSYKHIPQGGVSDFCNLLLGEQPKWEKDHCWDRKGISVLQGPQAQGLMSRKRLEWTEGCGRALDSSLWGLSRVSGRESGSPGQGEV